MAGISSTASFSKSCKIEAEDTPTLDQEVYKFVLEVKLRRDYVHGLIIFGQISAQLSPVERCAEASR